MINAQIAFEAAQKVNRANWLKAAAERLSDQILSVANTGKRELTCSTDDLIVGAENLSEAGEMLCYIDGILGELGYDHIIKPDGTLIIGW